MHVLQLILRDFVIYFNPRTKTGLIRMGVALCILIGTAIVLLQPNEHPENTESRIPVVQIRKAGSFGSETALSLIGSVEAVDQAVIQSETGGRVTAVRVSLGQRVTNGTIIATLENASQYAALLQAEGAYEAALAGAAQSDIGVSEAENSLLSAKNSAVSAFNSAYVVANNTILNQIDRFFTNPNSSSVPGLRIDGGGRTSYLNSERVTFNSILDEWRTETNQINNEDNLEQALTDAIGRTSRLVEMVDVFISALNNQDNQSRFTESELNSFSTMLSTTRAELNATLLSLENARTSLSNAEAGIERAEISGTGGDISVADANVKQALGTLRAAQAQYNKTILRSPITGQIQNLDVSTGDFISAFTRVAAVANQNALEITSYVSDDERNRIAVGDIVSIEDSSEGVITAIAPAIDKKTGKIEIKIQSESDQLKNGDTVKLSIDHGAAPQDVNGPIVIPITALKVESDRIVVFTVSPENMLIAHEIIEGPILGSSIRIVEGITADMEIVIDARGLNEGDIVQVESEE